MVCDFLVSDQEDRGGKFLEMLVPPIRLRGITARKTVSAQSDWLGPTKFRNLHLPAL
jgi:hypothetical protein